NSFTDADNLTPQADLSITNTDGVTGFVPGGSTTYNIIVSNAGPSTAVASTVTDLFPSAISSVSWTAVASAGSSVGAATGIGNISPPVPLLPAGPAIFTAVAQLSPPATGALVNTATVSPPPGLLDTTPANNTATDTDTLMPDLVVASITPNATSVTQGASFGFSYVVQNIGAAPAGMSWAGIYLDQQTTTLPMGWNQIGALNATASATETNRFSTA